MSNVTSIKDFMERTEIILNEYGTPVLARRCKTCGVKFTICPAPKSPEGWENCMAPTCASYDEGRDADKLFDSGLVVRDDDEDN